MKKKTKKIKRNKVKTHLVIGGCGFIGINLVDKLLSKNKKVIILDNLSRKGSEKNLEWIIKKHSDKLRRELFFIKADIVTDLDILHLAIKTSDYIYHLAAQVAVTTSVINPRHDFEVNALGTFNVLEAVRVSNPKATLIYSSTNKVYGGMENVSVSLKHARYVYDNLPNGVSEKQPLDFHSPYGCSKGSGDQYVRDFSRIYHLKTVVFRQSCIYGPRQFGVEDQGWISWFIIALKTNKEISIYGDGKQVRDILYVDDLLEAYSLAIKKIDKVAGQVFNIGGGGENTISIWSDLQPILEKILCRKITASLHPWRPGDQKIYISNISKVEKILGWKPKIKPKTGIRMLSDWVDKNLELFL